MIIGIDGNEANVKNRVGIGEYSFELLKQFSELKDKNLKFKIYLKHKPFGHMPSETESWEYKVIGPKKLWTQFALPLNLYLSRSRPDVFFSPSHYAPRFSPVPTVVALMDLAYFHFPGMFEKRDLYQLKNWTAYSVKKAKKILTISNASKNDILKEYAVIDENVAVIHLGIKPIASLSPQVYAMNTLKNKYNITGNYFLFVGTLQPRKNISRIIEAFSKIISTDNLQLIIAGKKGWMYEEILAAPEKFDVSDRVKFLDFVPDEDLELLYQHAICFVWPSLYEGFGLPILEAMKYDCPVITSNISSLPEAGGDAALYVNPEDVADISGKMQQILDNPKLRQEMIAKGQKHIKKFSWEKTARETLAILKEVVSSKRNFYER